MESKLIKKKDQINYIIILLFDNFSHITKKLSDDINYLKNLKSEQFTIHQLIAIHSKLEKIQINEMSLIKFLAMEENKEVPFYQYLTRFYYIIANTIARYQPILNNNLSQFIEPIAQKIKSHDYDFDFIQRNSNRDVINMMFGKYDNNVMNLPEEFKNHETIGQLYIMNYIEYHFNQLRHSKVESLDALTNEGDILPLMMEAQDTEDRRNKYYDHHLSFKH